MPTWLPGMPGISKDGMDGVSATWISISLSFSSFSRRRLRKASRVDSAAPEPTSASMTRSSALSCALASTSLRLVSRTRPMPASTQVADDLVDVAADIADLGELGGLDLDEGRAGELGEAARDLRLADAGRADHQNVLGQHLLAHIAFELLTAPAVAERDGDGALGVALADDVAVELGNDLAGGK